MPLVSVEEIAWTGKDALRIRWGNGLDRQRSLRIRSEERLPALRPTGEIL